MKKYASAEELRAQIEERRARKAAQAQQQEEAPTGNEYADLVPRFGDDEVSPASQRSHIDTQIDQIVDGLSFLDMYDRWFPGKNREPEAGRTESIKISCVVPGHADNEPSAWVNTVKNTFNCGVCETGGDVYDLAAYKFGIPTPGYKTDTKLYGKLRDAIVSDLGYTVVRTGGSGYLSRPEVLGEGSSEESEGQPVEEADDDNVIQLYEQPETLIMPGLDWRPLITPNTFLDVWMKIGERDDIPEEYYFWNGLLALSMALGRDTTLFDRRKVYGNLFVCIVGPTGSGKSQAKNLLDDLLEQAFPVTSLGGCEQINSPSSGEVLIRAFDRGEPDPADPKRIIPVPVRAVIDYNEMSVMAAKMSRNGSTLEGVLQDFYDAKSVIGSSSVTGGDLRATNAFASLLTTTQPKTIGRLFTGDHVSSGFVNRFIFASGTPKRRVAIGGEILDATPAVIPLKAVRGRYTATPMITWSDEAADLFTDFFHNELEKAKEDSELLSRIDLLAKKLILLFTANEMEAEVSVSVVEKVKNMFSYLLKTYGATEGQIGNDIHNEISDAILFQIRRLQGTGKLGPTCPAIVKALKSKTWPNKKVAIERSLKTLVNLGLVEEFEVPHTGPGRPAGPRYQVVG